MTFNIGCHISISKGYESSLKTIHSINANTFQFFIRNPYSLIKKSNLIVDKEKINFELEKYKINSFLVHAPYAINLCSSKYNLMELSKRVVLEDIQYLENNFSRCCMYNLHPGNHVGQGTHVGISKISTALNEITNINKNQKTLILLETMSGKGTEIGSKFNEIAQIIDLIENKNKNKIGVCLDTCHIYSSGYDIVNKLDDVFDEFDNLIGLNKLKAVHLNDSLTEFNSKKDRHEKLGLGSIGLKAIIDIIKHPKLNSVPFILETPNDIIGFQKEIKLLIENTCN